MSIEPPSDSDEWADAIAHLAKIVPVPERADEPPVDSPRFPERERYGCVNCGSTNHTTGDKDWCPKERGAGER